MESRPKAGAGVGKRKMDRLVLLYDMSGLCQMISATAIHTNTSTPTPYHFMEGVVCMIVRKRAIGDPKHERGP